jgi:hypothetical protein
MRGLTLAATAAGVLVLRCAADIPGQLRTFDNSEVELAVGNAARFGCTCLFVMRMPEAFCRDWVRATPDVATLVIDPARKSVSSTALVVWSAKAHFVDDKVGCVLE